jgi:hypothetical protein
MNNPPERSLTISQLYDKLSQLADACETLTTEATDAVADHIPDEIWLAGQPGKVVCMYFSGFTQYRDWTDVSCEEGMDPRPDIDEAARLLAWADILEQTASIYRTAAGELQQ